MAGDGLTPRQRQIAEMRTQRDRCASGDHAEGGDSKCAACGRELPTTFPLSGIQPPTFPFGVVAPRDPQVGDMVKYVDPVTGSLVEGTMIGRTVDVGPGDSVTISTTMTLS